MISLIAQVRDFFGRLASFQEQFPIWILFIAVAFLLVILQIAFSKRCFWLIPTYFLACLFSGFVIQQVDTATTFFRWWLIFCFSLSAFVRWQYPGIVCSMLGAYSAFMLVSVSWTPNPNFGLQLGVLGFMMTALASGTFSGLLFDRNQIRRLVIYFLIISPIFLFNGSVSIGQLGGERYAGAMGNAVVLFVITAGLLMPLYLWGAQTLQGNNRILCLFGFGLASVLGLLAGQRSGFFAGVIGCLPFIFRLQSKYLFFGLAAVGIAIPAGYTATKLFPAQTEFIVKRFFEEDQAGNLSFNTDTTGRDELWRKAFNAVMENPVIGYGAGADKVSGIGGFHNAYLQEWYNGGLIGLLLYLGASLVALGQTFFLMNDRRLPEEDSQIARLLFCWMVVLFLVSLFEAKMPNPSNILAFMLVIIGVAANRLKKDINTPYLDQEDAKY